MKGYIVDKQKSQQGSGLLAIIIILAVALIGAVGYILWQNFAKSTTSDTVVLKNAKTLTISEWNLEGVYSSDTTLKYVVRSGKSDFGRYGMKTGDYLMLYSNNIGIEGEPGSTGMDNCDNSIGEILRTAEPLGDDSWHIGNYYYSYSSPQSYCRNESGEILKDISDVLSAMKEFFSGAKSI